eukprot:3348433-Pyramimonas_sp.AAC.1
MLSPLHSEQWSSRKTTSSKADIQANPEKVSKARYTALKTWFDNKCFKHARHSKSAKHADFE